MSNSFFTPSHYSLPYQQALEETCKKEDREKMFWIDKIYKLEQRIAALESKQKEEPTCSNVSPFQVGSLYKNHSGSYILIVKKEPNSLWGINLEALGKESYFEYHNNGEKKGYNGTNLNTLILALSKPWRDDPQEEK